MALRGNAINDFQEMQSSAPSENQTYLKNIKQAKSAKYLLGELEPAAAAR